MQVSTWKRFTEPMDFPIKPSPIVEACSTVAPIQSRVSAFQTRCAIGTASDASTQTNTCLLQILL
jgi:hypothetical protein